MNKFIKAIIVFGDNKKSILELKEGINIITGESKTGKSALIEIINYCLCSKRNNVPKGIIDDYSLMYALVLRIGNKDYGIGRFKNNNEISIIETTDVKPDELTIEHFKNFCSLKDAQEKIEQLIGLNVSSIATDIYSNERMKASLRNTLSYNFQHQTLIANNYSLFYRFDKFEKRKQIIQQFPIFAGIVDQVYYSNLIEKQELIIRNNLLRKKIEKEKEEYGKILYELFPLVDEYYSLIGLESPFIKDSNNMNELKKILFNLPEKHISFTEINIEQKYLELIEQKKRINEEISNLHLKINSLNKGSIGIKLYNEILDEAIEITKNISYVEKCDCPICGNIQNFNTEIKEIKDLTNNINDELDFLSLANDKFIEDERKFTNNLDYCKKKLKIINQELKFIEENYIKVDKDLENKIIIAKERIKFYSRFISTKDFFDNEKELEKNLLRINELNEVLKKYDFDKEKINIQNEINNRINIIANKLDFEDTYRPANLFFNIETFELCYRKNDYEISLSEMGSGANWLSCHIALFISLLRVFVKRHDKSSILYFLFFDQPSQVYFPNYVDGKKGNDITAVSNIFKTIFEEYNDMKKEFGIMPQLILTEHVTFETLDEIKEEYRKYTIANWTEKDGKFIK